MAKGQQQPQTKGLYIRLLWYKHHPLHDSSLAKGSSMFCVARGCWGLLHPPPEGMMHIICSFLFCDCDWRPTCSLLTGPILKKTILCPLSSVHPWVALDKDP